MSISTAEKKRIVSQFLQRCAAYADDKLVAYQQQAAPPNWGSSQPLYRAPDMPEDLPSALDAVTIALAVLAFFAVLCLIPLWVQVYLVRFAGG